MTIRRTYTNWAETYDSDRNLTRDLDAVVTRQALAERHFMSILELGCGTGKNTELLAQLGEQVCAVDFSEGMIAKAKEKVQQGNVGFAVTDLTKSWPFVSNSFDLAVCNLVLEHIDDLAFIFGQAQRVLKLHGSFFICELHPFRQYQGAKANFQRSDQTTQIPAFIHNISDFLNAAEGAGLIFKSLKESWHEEDQLNLPRLVSFMFEK